MQDAEVLCGIGRETAFDPQQTFSQLLKKRVGVFYTTPRNRLVTRVSQPLKGGDTKWSPGIKQPNDTVRRLNRIRHKLGFWLP